jgi:enoyl-CoA hydratase/carnithine racemase
MSHCRYLVSVDDAALGMPEVTLPVVPGMEGCHWMFRKTANERWPDLWRLLLEGRPVRARDAVGWLVDYAGPLDDAIRAAWSIASGGDHGLSEREVARQGLDRVEGGMPDLGEAGSPGEDEARRAIAECVRESCAAELDRALEIQARHSAGFMTGKACRQGAIGTACKKTMAV